ncbi:hypothetical protein AC249_AIPGENE11557 [Exaiptasia diaphana]|nr:hypothetical protein AC249_AIPGENE11557 [Exaiptasia diaphana]
MYGNDCKNPLEVYMDKYKVTGCTKCDPNQSTCHLEICKCDAAIAQCLKGKPLNPRTNSKKYKCEKKSSPHKRNYYKRDYMNIDYNNVDYDSLYKLW